MSNFANKYEVNANTFTYDYYVQALRRYIKDKVYNAKLGIEEQAPIDPKFMNLRPACLLLGESNRMFYRYSLIESLLKQSSSPKFKKDSTEYFKVLYKVYQNGNYPRQIFGKRKILNKQERVLRMNDWVKEKGTLNGMNSFLRHLPPQNSSLDLPITIKIDSSISINSYVQLDGSHRRSIAYFNGLKEVQSNVVTIHELGSNISKEKPKYIYDHWSIFYNLFKKVILLK